MNNELKEIHNTFIYFIQICDRDRDLIPGLTFEDSAIQRLIAERCDRLIVILSNEFVRSDRHTFLFKYAQAISCGNFI